MSKKFSVCHFSFSFKGVLKMVTMFRISYLLFFVASLAVAKDISTFGGVSEFDESVLVKFDYKDNGNHKSPVHTLTNL